MGDNRSLAINGQERNYWYSISDLYLLTAEIRRQHLIYHFSDDSKQEYNSPVVNAPVLIVKTHKAFLLQILMYKLGYAASHSF